MRAKRATFTFWVAKSWLPKCPKWSIWAGFGKCYQTGQLSGNKNGGKCPNSPNSEIQMGHFEKFSINVCQGNRIALCHPATVIFVAKINQMKNVRSTQLDPDTTAREKNTFRDPAFLSLFSAFEFFVLEFYAASLWSPWWLLLFHAKNECHSKYAHWLKTTEIISLEFCHFPSIFVSLRIDLPGTVLTELLSTQNVDQWDLFYDFQTRWVCR